MLSRFLNSQWRARLNLSALGFLCGTLVWAWTTQFILVWGASHETASALAAAVGIATALSMLPDARRSSFRATWLWLLPPVAVILVPSILNTSLVFAARWGADALPDSRLVFLTALAGAVLTITPALWVTFRMCGSGVRESRWQPAYWIGLALALYVAPLFLGSWVSAQTLALVAAAACVAVFLHRTFRASATLPPEPTHVEVAASALSGSELFCSAAVALVAGGIMVVTTRFRADLFLSVASLPYAEWAAVTLGVAAGIRWRGRTATPVSRAARGLFILGLIVAIQAAMVGPLMNAALSISANVSNLASILFLRTLIVSALAFPIGLACGICFSPTAGAHSRRWSTLPMQTAIWFTVGFVATLWTTADIENCTMAAPGLLAAAALLRLVSIESTQPRRWQRFIIPSATAAIALTAAWLQPSLRDNRILFSGTHFQAYSGGLPADLIPAVDSGRLLRRTRTCDATWSLWSQRGATRHLHENGVFRSSTCIAPETCPQSATDVVNAVFPLAVHPSPRRVLVLGAENPALISTCIQHPIESILITDRDPTLLSLCREIVEQVVELSPHGDDRLAWSAIDPLLAPLATQSAYDVVFSADSSLAEFADAARFTVEHFRRIGASLAAGGIFCQRLTCFDFGTESMHGLARTMSAAFPSVQLVEIAPGECLLIGSSEPIVIDDTLVSRLEASHVRSLLGRAGWDWSIVMGLRLMPADTLREQVGDSAAYGTSTSQFAYAVPRDVMRWGPKFDDRAAWLAQHSQPIANYLGDSPAIEDISKRLSDVQLAQQVLTDHPDQYWAYRKWLRKRLQDRPRVVVTEGVNGLRNGLHPEDVRRKAYLLALGQTATRGATRDDLVALAEFTTPFDPMVAPFVAREISVLEQKSSEFDPAEAWHALVRSVYFTPGTDNSVRNVCEAMTTAVRHPDLFASSGEQWDHLNGLLDTLRQRWSTRIYVQANQRFGIADAEASLEAIDDVFETMETLQESAGVSQREWHARRTLLEKELTRPIRSWRSSQAVKLASQGLAIPTEPPDSEVDNADAEVVAPPPSPPRPLTPAQTAAEPLPPARQ